MTQKTLDLFLVAVLMVLTGLFATLFVNFGIPPYEDAAMLMRYAQHLAHGHGIVWNVGEPPLDGATDFLFMVIVALVQQLGFAVETSVRLVTIASHFATVALIYLGMREVQQAVVIPAFLGAFYFAVGPGLFLSAAYFGTPFFVLCIVLAWLLAQRLLLPDGRNHRAYVRFSLACLVAGLARPEGVLIAFFMLVAVGVLVPRKDFWRLAAVFCGVFLFLGGAYFLWRWHYFGHLWPNPYYKKGGGHFYFGSLVSSLHTSLSMGVPFVPMFLLAARGKQTLRQGFAYLIPIVGSTCMWVLLSDEANFGHRFQYPLLGLYVLSWYPLVSGLPHELGLQKYALLSRVKKIAIALAGAMLVGFVFWRHVLHCRAITYHRDGRYDIGVMLSRYADRGYTLATTEAGLLPLYSRWRAIDTWGLNDRWIAHNGSVTYEYLVRQKPDLIMWHEYFSPNHPPSAERLNHPWFKQVMVLKHYAEQNKFTLAAVFGRRPNDTHYYYVRSQLSEHDEIVAAIRATPYRWVEDGGLCTNYAARSNQAPTLAQAGVAAPSD